MDFVAEILLVALAIAGALGVLWASRVRTATNGVTLRYALALVAWVPVWFFTHFVWYWLQSWLGLDRTSLGYPWWFWLVLAVGLALILVPRTAWIVWAVGAVLALVALYYTNWFGPSGSHPTLATLLTVFIIVAVVGVVLIAAALWLLGHTVKWLVIVAVALLAIGALGSIVTGSVWQIKHDRDTSHNQAGKKDVKKDKTDANDATANLAASSTSIMLGDKIQLVWTSTGTKSLAAMGDWNGSKQASGDEYVTPAKVGTSVYSLGVGSDTKPITTIKVTVGPKVKCSTWKVNSVTPKNGNWVTNGVQEIQNAKTQAQAEHAALVWLDQIKSYPDEINGASRYLLGKPVNTSSLVKDGCATQAAVDQVQLLKTYIELHPAKVSQAPASATNSGTSNGKVYANAKPGITGNRKSVAIVGAGGKTVNIMARCGNPTTVGPPPIPRKPPAPPKRHHPPKKVCTYLTHSPVPLPPNGLCPKLGNSEPSTVPTQARQHSPAPDNSSEIARGPVKPVDSGNGLGTNAPRSTPAPAPTHKGGPTLPSPTQPATTPTAIQASPTASGTIPPHGP